MQAIFGESLATGKHSFHGIEEEEDIEAIEEEDDDSSLLDP